MRPTALYRIAGVLLIVCAALNAYGLSRFWRVAGSMNPVSFPVGHRPLTYAQVVLGLGLFWSGLSVFCLGHIWPGIWVPWLERRLKPPAHWDGASSRMRLLELL